MSAIIDKGEAARQRVVELHRAEWEAVRRLVQDAVRAAERLGGRDKARCLRLATEALANVHAGERRAWGLDTAGSDAGTRGDRSMGGAEKLDAESI